MLIFEIILKEKGIIFECEENWDKVWEGLDFGYFFLRKWVLVIFIYKMSGRGWVVKWDLYIL